MEIHKDKGIFVNLKALNDIRREAVEQLVKVRQHGEICFEKNTDLEEGEQLEAENGFYLNVLVRNEEQLKCCLEEKVNAIYVTDYILYKKYKLKIIYIITVINKKILKL